MSRAVHGDAKEEVEVAQVGHGELGAKMPSDGLKKGLSGGSENDVVDVQQEVGKLRSMS